MTAWNVRWQADMVKGPSFCPEYDIGLYNKVENESLGIGSVSWKEFRTKWITMNLLKLASMSQEATFSMF